MAEKAFRVLPLARRLRCRQLESAVLHSAFPIEPEPCPSLLRRPRTRSVVDSPVPARLYSGQSRTPAFRCLPTGIQLIETRLSFLPSLLHVLPHPRD